MTQYFVSADYLNDAFNMIVVNWKIIFNNCLPFFMFVPKENLCTPLPNALYKIHIQGAHTLQLCPFITHSNTNRLYHHPPSGLPHKHA